MEFQSLPDCCLSFLNVKLENRVVMYLHHVSRQITLFIYLTPQTTTTDCYDNKILFVAGKILERFGHVHCFSMCFICYALRLGLISIAPSPWWILPIEFVFQGPTYAMTYTTIVAYANVIAPPGASATMQGIAAGMDDGFGEFLIFEITQY